MDLINRLGPDEFAAVAEQYRNMDRYGDSRGEFDLILRGWARVDPMGALDYTTNQSKDRGETSLVLAAWAGKDAAAAERQFARFAAFYQGDVLEPRPLFAREAA